MDQHVQKQTKTTSIISILKNFIPILTVLTIFICLLLMNLFSINIPIVQSSKPIASDFSVIGEGTVEVVPDTAEITAAISVENASSVEAAEEELNIINNQIIQSMLALGLPEEQIETENYNINPSFSFDEGTREENGFDGNATVRITTKDTELTSQIVQQATAAGANTVSGPFFTIGDTSDFRKEARKKAIDDAKQQAKELSELLGIRLGRITNMHEHRQPYYDSHALEFSEVGSRKAPSPEFAEGQEEVSISVTLMYEIL